MQIDAILKIDFVLNSLLKRLRFLIYMIFCIQGSDYILKQRIHYSWHDWI